MATWAETKAKALTILGDDAKVPDLPDVIDKASDEVVNKFNEFDMKAKLLAVEGGNKAVRDGLQEFETKIESSDFKLNSKNKEDAKKIAKARKVLCGLLKTAIKARNDDDKMLDELNNHITQLGKYKQKPASI